MVKKTQDAIFCALPGRVVSYSATKQTATVQIVIQIKGETLKPIEDVPVVWPGGGGGFFHSGLSAGDNLAVLFLDEDFSAWWESGSISPAIVDDRHGLHAIAFPGLRREADPLGVSSSARTVVGASGDVRLGSDGAAEALALASKVATELSALKSAIAGAATGSSDGGAAFKAAILAALSSWPASVASTKVKADS